jgi:predicted nucleotidyltransferase
MDILKKIKNAVLAVEPEAEVYLFGSRARNDYHKDSDWDLLILLPGKVTSDRKYDIMSELVEIEIKDNLMFNRIFKSSEDWKNNPYLHATPFYQNVSKEAVRL